MRQPEATAWNPWSVFLTVALFMMPLQAVALDEGRDRPTHGEGEHAAEGGHHPNHLAFFGGLTKESEHGHTLEEATFGIEDRRPRRPRRW